MLPQNQPGGLGGLGAFPPPAGMPPFPFPGGMPPPGFPGMPGLAPGGSGAPGAPGGGAPPGAGGFPQGMPVPRTSLPLPHPHPPPRDHLQLTRPNPSSSSPTARLQLLHATLPTAPRRRSRQRRSRREQHTAAAHPSARRRGRPRRSTLPAPTRRHGRSAISPAPGRRHPAQLPVPAPRWLPRHAAVPCGRAAAARWWGEEVRGGRQSRRLRLWWLVWLGCMRYVCVCLHGWKGHKTRALLRVAVSRGCSSWLCAARVSYEKGVLLRRIWSIHGKEKGRRARKTGTSLREGRAQRLAKKQ